MERKIIATTISEESKELDSFGKLSSDKSALLNALVFQIHCQGVGEILKSSKWLLIFILLIFKSFR